MRFISTKTHGILDYVIGLALIAAPWLFGFARDGADTYVPVIIGILILGAALMTDYELGVVKMIPMPVHLTLDLLAGAFLAASPWLLGFSDYVSTPHLVVGLLEIGAALMTQKYPSYARVPAHGTTTNM